MDTIERLIKEGKKYMINILESRKHDIYPIVLSPKPSKPNIIKFRRNTQLPMSTKPAICGYRGTRKIWEIMGNDPTKLPGYKFYRWQCRYYGTIRGKIAAFIFEYFFSWR